MVRAGKKRRLACGRVAGILLVLASMMYVNCAQTEENSTTSSAQVSEPECMFADECPRLYAEQCADGNCICDEGRCEVPTGDQCADFSLAVQPAPLEDDSGTAESMPQVLDKQALFAAIARDVYAPRVNEAVAGWAKLVRSTEGSEAELRRLAARMAEYETRKDVLGEFVETVDEVEDFNDRWAPPGASSSAMESPVDELMGRGDRPGTEFLFRCEEEIAAYVVESQRRLPHSVLECLGKYEQLLAQLPSEIPDGDRVVPVQAIRATASLLYEQARRKDRGFIAPGERCAEFVRIRELPVLMLAYFNTAYSSALMGRDERPITDVRTSNLNPRRDWQEVGSVAQAVEANEEDIETFRSVLRRGLERTAKHLKKLTARVPRELRDACPHEEGLQLAQSLCPGSSNPWYDEPFEQLNQRQYRAMFSLALLTEFWELHPEFHQLMRRQEFWNQLWGSVELGTDFADDFLSGTCVSWGLSGARGGPWGLAGATLTCLGAAYLIYEGFSEAWYLHRTAVTHYFFSVEDAWVSSDMVTQSFRESAVEAVVSVAGVAGFKWAEARRIRDVRSLFRVGQGVVVLGDWFQNLGVDRTPIQGRVVASTGGASAPSVESNAFDTPLRCD